MNRPPPIIEYAHKIGKNTAEFTASDFAKFMRWWMKQPVREDLVMVDFKKALMNRKGAQTGRMQGKPGTVKEVITTKDVETIVIKNNKKYASEQDYRLSVQDQEQVDDGEAQEALEEAQQEEVDSTEVIAELGLTRKDVDALSWGLKELLTTYDFHEWSDVGERLQGIKDVLEGV